MTKKKFNAALAENIRVRRGIKRWTQAELADEIGISRDWISHFEGGRRTPSAFIYWKLQSALGGWFP